MLRVSIGTHPFISYSCFHVSCSRDCECEMVDSFFFRFFWGENVTNAERLVCMNRNQFWNVMSLQFECCYSVSFRQASNNLFPSSASCRSHWCLFSFLAFAGVCSIVSFVWRKWRTPNGKWKLFLLLNVSPVFYCLRAYILWAYCKHSSGFDFWLESIWKGSIGEKK